MRWPGLRAAIFVLLVAAPAPAAAQSFLGFRALGEPVLAADGRTVGVGNLGIGLARTGLSASDPAAPMALVLPTISLTMQPTWGSFEVGDETGTSNTTRFPLIAIGFPVPRVRGIATVSLAGYMDQRWTGLRSETRDLGGQQVFIQDTLQTSGGASVARIGWAQRIGPWVSLGATAGAYVGRLEQFFDRGLDSLATIPTGVEPYSQNRRWRYGGYNLAAGIALDPHSLVHLAGAVEWSSDLTEDPRPGTPGGTKRYSVPLRLSGGATLQLTPRMLLNGSVALQDWSTAAGFPEGTLSGRRFSYGGGIEWRPIHRETRSFPLRVGYRHVSPPFRYENQDPVESVWTLGAGINFVELAGIRLGWMDVAMERGSRTSHPLSERFWRATVSLGISRS